MSTENTEKPKRVVRVCNICQTQRAALKRPKTGEMICRECFYKIFEEEVHRTIVDKKLFHRGEKIAIAASGGKDSTVLAEVMSLLNQRHNYGLELFLLSIDEGIAGYRDDSLESVKRNQQQYKIPLKVVSYKELYGWTMDEIVQAIGTRNNCTFCGVFRRQALDRGAIMMGASRIATGHNADDVAETVLFNLLRGDTPRLKRCVNITTGGDAGDTGEVEAVPRCKPFMYTYEKEIVLYAYYKRLDYFSTECVYSPNAYRGYARDFLKDLESIRPSSILDIIKSAELLNFKADIKPMTTGACERCAYISSNKICKACVMLESLNRGKPRLALQKEHIRNAQMQL